MSTEYTAKLKCPVCDHRWEIKLTGRGDPEPHCPECMGPAIVVNVSSAADRPPRKNKRVNIR